VPLSLGIDLLSRGYFPREVPPTFGTEQFASFVADVGLDKLSAAHKKEDPTRLARHNLARPGGLRRTLSIPNPIHYVLLSKVVQGGWRQFRSHVSKSKIGASRPVPASSRRAFAPAESNTADIRALSRIGARYLLKADIQNFYPSIYAHSVPWSLHGKATAKANPRNNSYLGNRLDTAIRGMQDRQTIGIPIGPDASWLIAECIMSSVEQEFAQQVPNVMGYRYIDDYELAFGSLSEAESALGILQEVLAAYELNLNPRKTEIIELPDSIEDIGIVELRRWRFRNSGIAFKNDLRAYFDKVAELVNRDRGGNAASYAIARIRTMEIDEGAWPLLEALMLQLLVSEPSCALQVGVALSSLSEAGHTPTVDAISEASARIAVRHAPLGHGSEIAWALWMSIAHRARITNSAAEAVSKMDDSLVALLALHAQSEGLIESELDTSLWEQSMSGEELRGEKWLLAYEASVRGWLPSLDGVDHVGSDRFFDKLRRNDVRFYDSSAMTISADSPQAMSIGGGGGY